MGMHGCSCTKLTGWDVVGFAGDRSIPEIYVRVLESASYWMSRAGYKISRWDFFLFFLHGCWCWCSANY